MDALAMIGILAKSGYSWFDNDGIQHFNKSINAVMVYDEEILDELPFCDPGTIAFTAGFEGIWQKDTGGQWRAIKER